MAVISCSALSTLPTGAQPLDPPCAFLDGKTRRCRKSAEAQHFCCLAIICFSRLRFWITRIASGVRLRVNWISFFPSSLPWSCLVESMELERLTASDESWGLGTASQEHLSWVSCSALDICAGLLLFSWWIFLPKFLRFAGVQGADCFSLSDPPFSPPDLLVSSGTALAFFFPNSSLPGEEIRWWRLMGGKGIFVCGSDQGIKTCKCSKCGRGSPAQRDERRSAGIIQQRGGREAVMHLLSTSTGVQLVITHTQTDFMIVLAGRRGQETHQTKPRTNCSDVIPSFPITSSSDETHRAAVFQSLNQTTHAKMFNRWPAWKTRIISLYCDRGHPSSPSMFNLKCFQLWASLVFFIHFSLLSLNTQTHWELAN